MIEATYKTSPTPAEFAAERIALADNIVKVDCSRWIDFDSVPDDDTTPIVNLLSQYKSAEMSLRRIVGLKRRQNENDDIMEWKMLYDELKEKIADGAVDIELSDGTNVGSTTGTYNASDTGREDIRPNFGWDKYGEWVNNDDLEVIRGNVDTEYYT
jgi:hypothetical protein